MILHLETSTKVCSVAISENGVLKALHEVYDDQYAHGEQLTLLVEAVLEECALSPKDLSAVSIASGPGSYTGLRIGVSTAKGFCYALGIPLVAIDALTSLAAVARKHYPTEILCPMIDARRMEVYSTIFGGDGTILKPLSADILDENSYTEFGSFVFFGDGAPKASELWKDRTDLVFDTELRCSASGQVELAFEKLQKGEVEDVAYFEPLYLKEFQGTMPKKSAK